MDAVTIFKYVPVEGVRERVELAAFLGAGEVAKAGGKIAQGHYDHTHGVLAGTSGHAGHAFAAVPDGLALEQSLDFGIVLALDGVDDLSRIISVEFGCRAYRSAGSAVDAGLQALLEPVVLAEFFIQFPHLSVILLQELQSYPATDRDETHECADDSTTFAVYRHIPVKRQFGVLGDFWYIAELVL